jgi:hypothetical protein
VTAGLIFVPVLLAVHDLEFQLDGDVSSSTTTSIGGTTQLIDWDAIFTAAGANQSPLPANFDHAALSKDFNNTATQTPTFLTNDTTTYSTGSKDTLPITGGWQCNFDNNVNSKIDIMNAYAAAYTDPATKEEIIYFGLERNTNTGDANVGFWFLQDDVNCSSPGGSVNFTGHHKDGDLLVVSAFTNGGTVSTIDVYRWDGDDTGSLNSTPVAHGVDCRSATTGTGDTACAVSNRVDNGLNGTITTPWLTSNKVDGVGHSLRTSEFFEGGLNLTKSGLGGRCFNVFIGDTRSSQSLTATLFDFARGKLGECVPNLTTQVSATTSKLPGQPVTDLATIKVTGATSPDDAVGTVQFAICGPVASPNYPTCTSGQGGNITLIGSPVTLDNLQCDPDSPSNTDGISCALSLSVNDSNQTGARGALGAGNYCFLATAVLTNYVSPNEFTNQTTECFTVLQLQPTMKTDQTWTVKDEATVAVETGAGNLDGDLKFKLYSGTDCKGTLLYESSNIAISGSLSVTKSTDDATTVSGSLVFNSTPNGTPPQVSWLVTYTNKNPGHKNVTESCGTQNSVLTINGDGTIVNTP